MIYGVRSEGDGASKLTGQSSIPDDYYEARKRDVPKAGHWTLLEPRFHSGCVVPGLKRSMGSREAVWRPRDVSHSKCEDDGGQTFLDC